MDEGEDEDGDRGRFKSPVRGVLWKAVDVQAVDGKRRLIHRDMEYERVYLTRWHTIHLFVIDFKNGPRPTVSGGLFGVTGYLTSLRIGYCIVGGELWAPVC